MDLTCYLHPSWQPRLRPASPRRDWMEASAERFAYRCLPLAIANAHGWEIGSPCGFSACWSGGKGAEAVEIRLDDGTDPAHVPVSLFGEGTITFHVEALFRTPPGWNLWIGGPPNAAKDAIAPLGGVIETDWSPYTFTMNWRFTRPGQWIRWEEDEPFCFLFPVQRGVLDDLRPQIRPLAEAPELENAFFRWSASRDAFQEHVRRTQPSAPADKWQKLYYRGVGPEGEPGPADHQSKLRLHPFAPAEGAPRCPVARTAPAAPPAQAPALLRAASKVAAPTGPMIDPDILRFALRSLAFDAKPAPAPAQTLPAFARPDPAPVPAKPDPATAQADWLGAVAQRSRTLAGAAVPRLRAPSAEAFRDLFYAAGRPVVIEGALDGWPARDRWTPAYLAETVGDAPIDYQGGRETEPDFELYKDRHTRRMPFDRYLAAVTQADGGNDAYITAYNSAANRAALAPLHRDLGQIPYLTAGEGMLWIGPGGTFTPLHFDLTNNLLVQVVGAKQVILLPPSETPRLANTRHVFSDVHDITDPACLDRHPEARAAVRFEAEIGPGDMLFIPVGWWHQVRSRAFSVMLTYTNFLWPNDAWESFPAR